MPQANSITSRPRCTSPDASDSTLPCSSEMISASSLMFALTSSRKANRIFTRRLSDAWLHDSNAVLAAATAVSTSCVVPSTTSCCCCPLAGL